MSLLSIDMLAVNGQWDFHLGGNGNPVGGCLKANNGGYMTFLKKPLVATERVQRHASNDVRRDVLESSEGGWLRSISEIWQREARK